MKKLTALLCVLLILFISVPVFAAKKTENSEPTSEPIPEPTLSPEAADYDPEHPENLSSDQLYALSAVLMTQDKGEVIFEKDPDTIRYPASMTKILTVLLGILYVDDLNQTVTVSNTGAVTISNAQDVTLADNTITIVNQSGTELPSTGGIGTTIFYIVGSILVLGAAVILITRRRMNQE